MEAGQQEKLFSQTETCQVEPQMPSQGSHHDVRQGLSLGRRANFLNCLCQVDSNMPADDQRHIVESQLLIYRTSFQTGWIRSKNSSSARKSVHFLFCFSFALRSAQSAQADLGLAGVDDSGLLAELDLARGGTGGLESADNLLGLLVGDLAEDDVAAIEPLSLDSGDEELRAVAGGGGRYQ